MTFFCIVTEKNNTSKTPPPSTGWPRSEVQTFPCLLKNCDKSILWQRANLNQYKLKVVKVKLKGEANWVEADVPVANGNGQWIWSVQGIEDEGQDSVVGFVNFDLSFHLLNNARVY